MKFYYIDDTMFQPGVFQEEIRHRLLCHLRRNQVRLLLVSASFTENDLYHAFVKECRNIPILRSPALFDVEGIRGNLQTSFAEVDGYPVQHTYSGSCVEFDEETKTTHRVYLDLFIDHHEEDSFDFLADELEKVIQDKILHMKNKKDDIH